MKLKQSLIFLVLLSAISSCDKDNEEGIILEGTYESDSFAKIEQPIMYTVNGQITDLKVIGKYILRHQINNFSLNVNQIPVSPNSLIFAFTKDDKVTITGIVTPKRVEALITRKEADQLIIAEIDSSVATDPPGPKNDCLRLFEKSLQVNSERRCRLLPSSTGFSSICKYKLSFPITIREKELILPLLNLNIQRNFAVLHFCGYGVTNNWNLFNAASLNQLRSGDTILIQQNELKLIKR